MIKVDSTHHLSEITTVPALLNAVGESTVNRWIAIGQTDSKVHWQYGAEVDALVSEGARVGVVCKAIAIKAGKSFETIRKSYYTYIKFSAEDRQKYSLCPYSIFNHARMQDDPYDVLDYYLAHRGPSVEEVEAVFVPPSEDKEFDKWFSGTKYPRYFYRICQELYGIDPIWKQEADEHIKALAEIIEKANK